MNVTDFEKYYGDRKYKEKQIELEKIDFTNFEKKRMLREINKYAMEKEFDLYHDLMDDIMDSHPDWFNMLTFNKKENKFILDYIKSKNRIKHKRQIN